MVKKNFVLAREDMEIDFEDDTFSIYRKNKINNNCDGVRIYYCLDLDRLSKYFNIKIEQNGLFLHEQVIRV